MTPTRYALIGSMAAAATVALALVVTSSGVRPALAQGVGRASWTPAESTTIARPSRLLVAEDAITYRTDALWDRVQADGLQRYIGDGLRYTHEVNDRSGRLSATGYWATNHPDPAFDRDDDDGDGRWEEAEVVAGAQAPTPGQVYSSLIQFSRWHGKRAEGQCTWAWDRRLGSTEVLSQLSRDLLGEWQAERYTLTYDTKPYPRVGTRPPLPSDAERAHCREPRPGPTERGVVVTFSAPLAWSDFVAMPASGSGRWTAFEAIGSSDRDELTWTCGGPVGTRSGLTSCRAMGVRPQGVVAAAGYFDDAALEELDAAAPVVRVDALQDAVTGLLLDVGGFGVQPPGLTVNDAYWELYLSG